jgi:hypothetical protein
MREFEGRNTQRWRGKYVKELQKVKVVENQKHGQNDVDNHTGQNYNVEHF